jgi:hypothetical protein
MANMRYYAAKATSLIHASGRTYAVAAGGVTDVVESEAQEIDHRSVGAVKLGRSGTTAQRPTAQSAPPVRLGDPYLDTTLGKVVFYVGSGATSWVDMTGASA